MIFYKIVFFIIISIVIIVNEYHKWVFFELITEEPIFEYLHYYYFVRPKQSSPCSIKQFNKYPYKLWQLIRYREEEPFTLTRISFFKYVHKKYIKKSWQFLFGYRINWEKEEYKENISCPDIIIN